MVLLGSCWIGTGLSVFNLGVLLSLIGVGPCGFPGMMLVSVSSLGFFTPSISTPGIYTPGGSML